MSVFEEFGVFVSALFFAFEVPLAYYEVSDFDVAFWEGFCAGWFQLDSIRLNYGFYAFLVEKSFQEQKQLLHVPLLRLM